MEFFSDIVKAFGGGLPAAIIAILCVAVGVLFRAYRDEAKDHLATAKLMLPVGEKASANAQQVTDALKEATTVLRQIREEQLVDRARANAQNEGPPRGVRTSGGK